MLLLNMSVNDPHLPVFKLLKLQRPLVIAHRGYSQLAPENTTTAFELAFQAGADLVELDCRQSRDDQALVIHDATLDRTTDARQRWRGKRIKVASRTAAEIQSLDAGHWFDPKYTGTRVPLLSEALDLINCKGGCALVERKAGAAAACLEVLRKMGLINHVIVQSFDWEYLAHFHQLEPRQILGALGPPSRLSTGRKPRHIFPRLNARWLDEMQRAGASVGVWNARVSKRSIRLAHGRGFKVWVYTVNNLRLARRLLAAGVDGLITNNPALIWKAIALGVNSNPE